MLWEAFMRKLVSLPVRFLLLALPLVRAGGGRKPAV